MSDGRLMWLQWPKVLNAPLSEVDPDLADIIEHEKNRQWKVTFKKFSFQASVFTAIHSIVLMHGLCSKLGLGSGFVSVTLAV